jgi:hypothetical protein
MFCPQQRFVRRQITGTYEGDDTMKSRRIKPIPIAPASLLCICIVCLLCACGGGGDGSSSDTGSISFSLDWVHPGPQRGFEKSPSGNVCVDYLIETVSVNVQHSSGTDLSESWDCDIPGRTGTIDNVPAESGYSLTVNGVVASRDDWWGQVTGIRVTGNQDTNLGTIEMVYQGDDDIRPTVTPGYPNSGDTGVLRNTMITATFSEDVVAASVNTSSCTVFADGTSNQVTCTVNYDPSTDKVTIDLSGNLVENTTYRVTITTAVEDHAGLTMASDESWTFTTGVVIGDPLVWDTGSWDETLWQ